MTASVAAASGRSPVELEIEREGPWMHVRFGGPHRCLGWTIAGGGLREASGVSWRRVTEAEIAPPLEARVVIARAAAAAGLAAGTPILVTGCDLDEYQLSRCAVSALVVDCVATVGLGNALRAGDPPGASEAAGTINVLCRVSEPLTDEALIEALSIAVEARTGAVLEARFASRRSGASATGTGTDCVVLAAPIGEGGLEYAGKHTALGHAIGRAVGEAVGRGIAAWIARNGDRRATA